jgi:hypothetical protein
MVSCVKMFTCAHHLGIMSLRVWFVTFIAPFMALSRLLVLGFSTLPLFVHVSPRDRTLLLLYVDNMTITDDDPEYIAFIKAHLSD